MDNVSAELQVVATPPILVGKLDVLEQFLLVARPRPGVEEVAAPPVGRKQHVLRSLAMGVAGKSGVLEEGTEKRSGSELVMIVGAHGKASLPQVRRSGLRYQSIDVCELLLYGEQVHVQRHQVLG